MFSFLSVFEKHLVGRLVGMFGAFIRLVVLALVYSFFDGKIGWGCLIHLVGIGVT